MMPSASRSFAVMLASAAFALAQDEQPQPPVTPATPPVPTPAVPRPSVIAPLTPAAPAAGQPGAPANPANLPLAERPITQPIIEPKMNGANLAKLYQEYTGRRVLVTAAANQAEFAFEQSPPLTYGEAAKLLRKAAALEGFVFVPDSTDDNLDILTTTTGGPNPKSVSLEIYTEADQLPEGGNVVSYVMPLKHLKPETAAQIFNQVIGQVGAFGSITPVPNAAAIVITENTSLIRRLIQLKDEVDKPSSNVSQKFIKVQFADVTELAQTLNDLLNSQQQAQRTAGVQRTEAPAPNPGAAAAAGARPGGEASSAGEDTPIQIIPDARTNRIFAMGRPVDLLFVETLVREFDVQSDNKNFLRRKLRFLSVRDFLPIAGDALTRAFTGTGSGGAGAGGQGASGANFGGGGGGGGRSTQAGNNRGASGTGSRTQSSSPFGGSSGGIGGGSSGGGFGGSGSGSSGGGSRGNTLQAPDVSTAPESILVGRTLLVADNITNSIVVQGTPASVEIIEKLLDEVDVKADQVMISCVFGQLALDKGYSFGVDYARTLGSKFAGRGGSGSSNGFSPGAGIDSPPTDGIPLNPFSAFDPGNLATTTGLGLYGRVGKHLHIYLQAAQDQNRFKVLARPTIFTSNNQKGTITSGTRIAIPTNTVQYSGTNSPSTSFEYQDVDLSLEVIPLINSKDEITLQIYLVSNDIGQNRPVGALGEGQLEIPDIIKRELLTTVTVPNNETIALGGLITNRDEKGRSGIPILSQIPLIGGLFGKETSGKKSDELLIFIRPSIVHDSRTLDAVQEDEDRRFKIAPDARRFSEGPGVLPVKDDTIMPIDDKGKNGGVVDEPAPAAKQKRRNTAQGKR